MRAAIAPRNVVGLEDPARRNLYPVDLDTLIERHALLGLTRDDLIQALPRLRGMGPEPDFRATAARAGPPSTVPRSSARSSARIRDKSS
jgi:hypothetical protein